MTQDPSKNSTGSERPDQSPAEAASDSDLSGLSRQELIEALTQSKTENARLRSIYEKSESSRESLEEDLQEMWGALDSSPVIFWAMETETGRYLYLSAHAERVLGYERESWNERDSWLKRLHPDDRKWLVPERMATISERGAHRAEYRMLAADGKVRWFREGVRVRSRRLHQHGGPGGDVLVGVMSDITKEQDVFRKFQRAQSRLQTVVNSAPMVLWAVDAQGVFTLSMGGGLQALGLEPGQVLGKNLFEIYADAPQVISSVRQAFEGVSHEAEGAAGGRYWSNSYIPQTDRKGNVEGLVGVSFDITERAAEEKVRRALDRKVQEAQRLESLGVLAGGIAHDFNNLLVSIMGHAELALMDLSPLSPVQDNLQDIIVSSKRAAELAKQMLAYSGKGRYLVRPLDLSELIREMDHLLSVSFRGQTRAHKMLDPALPIIEGDAAQLRQVVMNLVSNAAEAIEASEGLVHIRTGTIRCDHSYLASTELARHTLIGSGIEGLSDSRNEPPITDKNLSEGMYVFLEVSDTGQGMDKVTQTRIFDPFYTTKEMGRGLGLAAVLGIVRGHGGTIKVYSEPGRGTTLKVLFPASEESVFSSTESSSEQKLNEGGTILIVDDEESARRVARRSLETAGYEVIEAKNGREAVEIYRESRDIIVAILLDLTMPVMGGNEAFSELRRINPKVPIVMASGYNERDVIGQLAGKGLTGFVGKPFHLQNLMETVNNAVTGSSAPPSALDS